MKRETTPQVIQEEILKNKPKFKGKK